MEPLIIGSGENVTDFQEKVGIFFGRKIPFFFAWDVGSKGVGEVGS